MNRTAAVAPLSAHAPSANESKRDKKRREIIEKVEKQHAEKIQSFQQIYTDVTTDLVARNQALLRDPSTSVSLQAPMYMVSLERDAWLESIDTQYEYKMESARKLYAVERQKIQDEYKKSRELVRQRLLDGLEERRRKIREDKETVNDIVADTLNDMTSRSRSSRPTTKPPAYPANDEPPSRLTTLVQQADALLSSFTPPSLGTSLSIDHVISPLPYSLGVMPPPTQPDRVGKNARRGRGVQRAGAAGGDYESGTPGLETTSADTGRSAQASQGNGTNGGAASTTTGPNNTTVIRISPAMSGYAKVPGWTPGKPLEDLKSLAVASEFEREGDVAMISGFGRRGRQAGKAAAAAIAGRG